MESSLRKSIVAAIVSLPLFFNACGSDVERPVAVVTPSEDALAMLEPLGYVGGSESWDGEVGVTRHEPDRVHPGLNFYVSGHAAEAVLMDMEGRELHRWNYEFHRAFPDAKPAPRSEERGRHHWRRAVLLDDGGLVAIFEGEGLIRIDRDSGLVWANPIQVHHAAQVTGDGELYVLSRLLHRVPVLDVPRMIVEDFVAVIDLATGLEKRSFSVLDALQNSDYRSLVSGSPTEGDIFHTNSLEVLDGRFAESHAAFRAGNVLLSSRILDAIFVMDLDAGRVVWARTGSWRGQHEPHMLPGDRILLFDNLGEGPGSRILELSLDSTEERVVYGGADTGFFTPKCGAATRLPNGNTLIIESSGGRAFEITTEGEIVWEFLNPHRTGEKQYIAYLYDLIRVPAQATRGWRSGPQSGRIRDFR